MQYWSISLLIGELKLLIVTNEKSRVSASF
jgi:hypothetical protein